MKNKSCLMFFFATSIISLLILIPPVRSLALECDKSVKESIEGKSLEQQIETINKWSIGLESDLAEILSEKENVYFCNLIEVIESKNIDEDTQYSYILREYAIEIIGKMQAYDKDIIKALIQALKDPNYYVSESANSALEDIIYSFIYKDQKERETGTKIIIRFIYYFTNVDVNNITMTIETLKEIDKKINDSLVSKAYKNNLSKTVNNTIGYFELKLILNRIVTSYYIYLFVIIITLYIIIFCFFPSYLLIIDDLVSSLELENQYLKWLPSPAKFILFISHVIPFKYHPRVLDAWIKNNLKVYKENFFEKPNVKPHEIYVPIPITLNSRTTIELLKAEHLRNFKARRIIFIWGDGGIGKTSLAIEIARWAISDYENERLIKEHRILPVLIDSEIAPNSNPFMDAIKFQLIDGLGEIKKLPSKPLLEQLLQQKRILVIIDRFSELSDATRKLIKGQIATQHSLVDAFVFTSRNKDDKEYLSSPSMIEIEINRINKDAILSNFMSNYIEKRGAVQYFARGEILDNSKYLFDISSWKDVTAMLVKLYIEFIILKKEQLAQNYHTETPKSIPEIITFYIENINHKVQVNSYNDVIVNHDARVVAWQCIDKNKYCLVDAEYDEVIQKLSISLSEEDAKKHFDYLREKLGIIKLDKTYNRVSFTLDPIAEYLAALHFIILANKNNNMWSDLLEYLDKRPVSFMRILLDCIQDTNGNKAHVDQFIIEKIKDRVSKSEKSLIEL